MVFLVSLDGDSPAAMSSSQRRETCISFAIVSQVSLLSSLSFFRRAARRVCAGAAFALGSLLAVASLSFAAGPLLSMADGPPGAGGALIWPRVADPGVGEGTPVGGACSSREPALFALALARSTIPFKRISSVSRSRLGGIFTQEPSAPIRSLLISSGKGRHCGVSGNR